MTESSRHVLTIFGEAIERPTPEEQLAYLDRACEGDAVLRARVEALLRAHQQAGPFLQGSPDADLPSDLSLSPPPRFEEGEGGRGEGPTLDDPITERPGTVIGPYKLLEQIGEGGFGVVFMAEQQEPVRRKVALKVLKPGMDTRQVVARFEAERQALAIMDHPNIAKVFDGGATGSEPGCVNAGRPYFVMELVKGIPITEFCDQDHLTPRQRLELFVPVCQAVQHAHQKGIIHRDLKPSNVLISVHDGQPAAKVIDFGIAKATSARLTDKTLFTGFAQRIGTPLYMSPEQAGQSPDIDTRSDIYSLGVLLYELLTGTTPLSHERLKGAAYDEICRIIREEEPPKPSTRLSESKNTLPSISANRHTEPAKLTKLVRGELDWIVMKALEKDRNRRYATANGFAMDVQRYLADEPVLACPPSKWYRLRKFVRRNKGRLAVAAGLFLAATVMAASIGWAVGDRAARRAELERQARDSLNTVRTLVAENKLAAACEKLTQIRAQLGNDWAAQGNLAGEVEACEASLDRFQQFLELIDRAHQAETGPFLESPSTADGSHGGAGTPADPGIWERRTAAGVPFVLEALQRYDILERDDWNSNLEGGLLERRQVEQVRRLAYEELIRLAFDVVRRQKEHRSGRTLSPEAAARQALVYLDKAESAHRPTQVFYTLRARWRKALGEEAGAQADTQRAEQTPATMALDHILRGQDAWEANQLAEGIQAFEAALRVEPTHYWSLMWLGYCLCDLGRGPEDFAGAARVFTGCILARPDHAHAYFCRAVAYSSLGRYEEAVADYSTAIELKHALAWYNRGNAYKNLGRLDKALADYSQAVELNPKFAPAWDNRGFVYSNLGHLDKAVADHSRAIEVDPKLAPAWNNRGAAYAKLGQPEKAIADYSQAVELDPKLAPAWCNRGSVYNVLGQWDKAVADCSKAIDLDPKLAPAWYNRGNAHRDLGQPDKAVADFSQALELDPKLAPAWCNRGAAYAKLGQPDKAVADYSQAIQLDPKHLVAWYNRGNAHNNLGQLDKAVADYSQAIELDPTYAFAWSNRGWAYNQLGQWDKAVADCSKSVELEPKYALAWYNRGLAHGKLRQPVKAVADYSRAIELDPKLTRAWYGRGLAYANLRQPDRALADLSQTIELDPTLARAWYNRGLAYADLRQPDKALADFSRAIELDPKDAQAWTNRGVMHDELGQPGKALADFSQAIELNPNLAHAWKNRGVVHEKLGQPDKAVADCSRAIELDPKLAPAWYNRGLAYFKLGQPDKAVADFSKAIELDPKYALAWNNRGAAYNQLGQPGKAIADLSKAIELDPKFAPAWNNRGWAYSELGQPDKAVADLSKAIELDPRYARAWNNRGLAYTKLGQPDKAVADISKAVELAPKVGSYWQTLGTAYYRAGDWKAAIAALDKSVELGQGGDAVDRLFLAMAHKKLGNHDEARKAYAQAVQWLEKNKEALEIDKGRAEELRRFRAEAEEVLELKKK